MIQPLLIHDITDGYISTNAGTATILAYNTKTADRQPSGKLNGATFSVTSIFVGYNTITNRGAGGRITGFFRVSSDVITQIGTTHVDITTVSDLLIPPVISYQIDDTSINLEITGGEEGQVVLWRARSEITVIQS